MRAGVQVLLMAADPINRGILRATLEQQLKVEPGYLYKVSAGGREALFVAFVVERWLQSAPQGPIDASGDEAAAAVVALTEGWSATVIHMLAHRPRTFRELHWAIDGLSRRALRRHLAAMCRAGQVETRIDADAGGTVYAVTDWLRAGIAALIASARAEHRDPKEGMAPIDALDVEAAFLLTLPLLELPKDLSGSCRFGVNLNSDKSAPIGEAGSGMVGVTVRVDQGRVVCTPGVDLRADTWGAGTAAEWLDTVIEPDAKLVRTGGDKRLAATLLNALHQTLFGIPTR